MLHSDIHVIGLGPFGQATAGALVDLLPGSGCTLLPPDATVQGVDLLPAKLYVTASWRPHPPIERLLDAAAATWRLRWLPIVYDHPVIRIGPNVGPGQACHDCLRRRLLQTRPAGDVEAEVSRHFETRPLAGPRGFLLSHAQLAATVAARVVLEPEGQRHGPATVWTYHVLSQATRTSRLVSRHRCPRCRGPRPAPEHHADALLDVLAAGADR